MASKDFNSIIQVLVAFPQQPIQVDTTTVGLVMGTAFFESIELIVQGGVVINGEFQLLIEDGNDPSLSDAAPVAPEFLIGDPNALITATDEIISLGYVGHKQFVRPSIISVAIQVAGGIEAIGVVLVSDGARHFPFIPLL